MWFCQYVGISRRGGSTRQPQRTEPCQCVSGQPWAYYVLLQGQMQPFQCTVGGVLPALRAAAGLGRWFVGAAVLPVCGDFQRRRQHAATTAHIAVPVCEWPALGMPWGTERANAVSAVRSRCGGACTAGCIGAGQMVCEGCGLWKSPEEEAALGNQSTEPPCQYVSGQPWACHAALQGQMQPL